MLSRPINLGLVDDHALFRKALKNYLSDQKDLHVAFQSSSIADLIEKLKDTSVDILLMDMFMPEMNGNDALPIIHSKCPSIKILMLSMSSDMDLISKLLEEGIHGYISKSDEPEELLLAIQAIANGRIYRNRVFTEALYWNKQNNIRNFQKERFVFLKEREKKILQLIWEEKSNKEIADMLFLGVRSVEKIRQDIKEKIGAKSTVGLLKYGIDQNIIRANQRGSGVPT
jgi:DNA-binding NarL/FixJ family response regulator